MSSPCREQTIPKVLQPRERERGRESESERERERESERERERTRKRERQRENKSENNTEQRTESNIKKEQGKQTQGTTDRRPSELGCVCDPGSRLRRGPGWSCDDGWGGARRGHHRRRAEGRVLRGGGGACRWVGGVPVIRSLLEPR
jgi:hypothetical protein